MVAGDGGGAGGVAGLVLAIAAGPELTAEIDMAVGSFTDLFEGAKFFRRFGRSVSTYGPDHASADMNRA